MTNPTPIEPPPASTSGQRCRVRVGSADGILAIVPHLLGFHPSDSLVLLGIGGPHARVRLAFRYDLPDPPEAGLAADIAAHAATVLTRQRLSTAVAIGYGGGRAVTPVMDIVAPALRKAGVKIHDMLRVEDGRYWSYMCDDPACCSPDGVPFDPASHPASEALAAAGLTARGDRAELASTLAPVTSSAEAMSAAVARARRRGAQLVADSIAASAGGDVLQPVADAGRRAVRKAVGTYRRGARVTDLDEIAWLGVALADLRVRDDAWARMDPDFHDDHRRLWTDLVRLLPAEFAAPPAALLAFTAWQAGDGALASIAIERALEADPGYSMALLLAEALHAGLPPSAARLPMTPKQVAASYARQRREGGGRQSSDGTAARSAAGRPAGGGTARDGAARGSAAPGGAARNGPEASGPARSGPARSGPARSGPARSGPARSGPARSGPVRSGPVRSGPVRSGPAGGGPGRGAVGRGGGARRRQVKR